MLIWQVFLVQRRGARRPIGQCRFRDWVDHCATVEQAIRTAQRMYPGWTVVAAERVS